MFGPIMRFQVQKSGLKIELAPLSRSDMPEFIKDGGMQRYEVLKFLGRTNAVTLEDEYDWYDNKASKSESDIVWGIFVIDEDKTRTVIGTTGLHDIYGRMYFPYASATSGFLIFRPEYWGKGIAGACHRARTMYAFDVLGLSAIRSAVILPNVASRRAIESVGYALHHKDRMHGYYRGKPREDNAFLCVNPGKYAWPNWWQDLYVPKRFREARVRCQEAVAWARDHVEMP